MKNVFVLGTAGSGKSLLTSKIYEYYTRMGAFAATLNLDPGAESLPYTPDVDVRNYIDMASIMRRHNLGPNGALVAANDMIAARLDDIQEEVGRANPDYMIIDTPGQMELFAYRSSGPYLVEGLEADARGGLFLFDGVTAGTVDNFISIMLLAASVRIRLNMPCINILSKSDMAGSLPDDMAGWATDTASYLGSIRDGETYVLMSGITRNLGEYIQPPIAVSGATGEGLAEMAAILSRAIGQGEEVED